ncbi:helix-turn-helix domain-containing protein [Pseudonocardia nematodicida]|uniref:Helix-turn-helix domain-containing protein n=1 Tax=Pseudonocardia nematodicida TaxID=1206997 RepID=A0ABV1KG48_9PSEU
MEERSARRGRPPTSDSDRRRQRLAISREAVRLFRDRGVADTPGAEIARAAGVSERTLWRLFRTKEACVEPLLTEALDGFCAVLRSWPDGVELDEHLRVAYRLAPGGAGADTRDVDTRDVDMQDVDMQDIDAVLAVVRMSRENPALRAVWLVLQERAEPTIAEVLAPRLGIDPGGLSARLRAASVNAAFRVVTDDVAGAAAGGITAGTLDGHRHRLAEILRDVGTA